MYKLFALFAGHLPRIYTGWAIIKLGFSWFTLPTTAITAMTEDSPQALPCGSWGQEVEGRSEHQWFERAIEPGRCQPWLAAWYIHVGEKVPTKILAVDMSIATYNIYLTIYKHVGALDCQENMFSRTRVWSHLEWQRGCILNQLPWMAWIGVGIMEHCSRYSSNKTN